MTYAELMPISVNWSHMLYSFSRCIEWACPHTNRIINKKKLCPKVIMAYVPHIQCMCVCALTIVHVLTYAIMLPCFYRQPRPYLSKLVSEVSAADGRISSQTGRILGEKPRKKSANWSNHSNCLL